MVKSERVGAVRWDIRADASQFTRTLKSSVKMTGTLRAAMNATRTPLQRYSKGIAEADAALKKGTIDQKAYNYELKRLNAELKKGKVYTDAHTRSLLKNNTARKLNWANFGGSAFSAIGTGGAGAGAARVLGLGAGGGSMMAMVAPLAAIATGIKSLKEYAKIEASTAELQVYLGTKKGMETSTVMRNIAANSALTTQQLVKNAAVLLSYGNEFEDLTDFTRRLGQASGGDTEQFGNLTKAFAQINAMGRLMGQEKLQLVNAGFSLKLIAKEAGVSMDSFSKAMEDGLITSAHVNAALIKATDKGGLYETRLERQGNTLTGRWDILWNNMDEAFANFGEAFAGGTKDLLTGMTDLAKAFSESQGQWNEINKLKSENERILALLGKGEKEGGSTFLSDNLGVHEVWDEAAGKAIKAVNDVAWYPLRSMWDHFGNLTDIAVNGSSWENLTLSPSSREDNKLAELGRQQYNLGANRAAAEAAGITIDEEAAPAEKPIVDKVAKGVAKANKKAGLDFGANSVGEYNYLRDMMDPKNYEEKSFFQLKAIAENTSSNKGSWRRQDAVAEHDARVKFEDAVIKPFASWIENKTKQGQEWLARASNETGTQFGANADETANWKNVIDRIYAEADSNGNNLLDSEGEIKKFENMWQENRTLWREGIKDREREDAEAKSKAKEQKILDEANKTANSASAGHLKELVGIMRNTTTPTNNWEAV